MTSCHTDPAASLRSTGEWKRKEECIGRDEKKEQTDNW